MSASLLKKMRLVSQKDVQDPEAPSTTTDTTRKAPIPMTQISEALYFASAGGSDLGDDSWDPFTSPDPGDCYQSSCFQAGTRGKPPTIAELNDEIREVEKDITGLHTKKGVLEDQQRTATEGVNNSPCTPKQDTRHKKKAKQGAKISRKTLLQEIIKVIEKITSKEEHLKKLKEIKHECKLENARRNYRKDRNKFVHLLLRKVECHRLDDVKVMTEALDKEGVNIADFIDDEREHPLLHKALLENKQDIVEFLLKHKRGREMAMKAMKTEYCEELTPLYIAIQQGKAKNVRLLLDVLTPDDVNKKVKNTAYEKTFFNELPLAAALWSSAGSNDLTELTSMFKCLVYNGARLDLQTEDGDTLLHLLVAQSGQSAEHLDYFRKFLKQTLTEAAGVWYKQQHPLEKDPQVQGIIALFAVENNMGFTPLTLAAQFESPLYADLINWKNVMRYPDAKRSQQFSNFDAYDVTKVTSLERSSGKGLSYNRSSVMHVLAHNNVDITQAVSDEDISTIAPLKSIINLKWELYQFIFYFWGFIHLVYMSVFTDLVFRFGPKNVLPVQSDVSNGSSAAAEMLLQSGYYGPVEEGNPWFILFASLPITYITFEIVDDCSVGISKVKFECEFRYIINCLKDWISSLFHLTGNGIYRLIGLLFSIFTLAWIILHMIQSFNQDIILSIALLFGWLFTIMFTRTINFPDPSSQIGAFSIMVQRMLFHDLFPFIIISSFVLVAFSSAIHATLLHSEETATDGTKFTHTVFDMLKYYSALADGQDHTSSREKEFAKAVLSVYGIISVVLLINMLIAAMNKTYEMVRTTHRDLVVRQRLAILLMLERRLPFQWLREQSETRFETVEHKRYLGVVSIKKPVPIAGQHSTQMDQYFPKYSHSAWH